MFNVFNKSDKKKIDSQISKQVIKISGMTCTACALTIDGDLEDLEGVKKAQTNYAKGECVVEFDPSRVTQEKLLKTIEKEGYKATLWT